MSQDPKLLLLENKQEKEKLLKLFETIWRSL